MQDPTPMAFPMKKRTKTVTEMLPTAPKVAWRSPLNPPEAVEVRIRDRTLHS